MRNINRRVRFSTSRIVAERGHEAFVAPLGRRFEELKRRKRVLMANSVVAHDIHRIVVVGCNAQSMVAFSVWRSMLLSSQDCANACWHSDT